MIKLLETLTKMSDADFEDVIKDFPAEAKETIRKSRDFQKLMTNKTFYQKAENAVAKQIWKEANAE